MVAHVDEATGKLVAELPDGARLPNSVLEELACNAKFTGVVYDRRGRPIWRAHSVRRATEAQRQLLIARDGGCFACGAHPDICDAHHVRPVSEGGATSLDNLVLACWRCHHKIHYLGWQIHGPPGRRTLHPPDTVHYGPAHAPERRSLFRSAASAVPDQPQLLEPVAAQSPNRTCTSADRQTTMRPRSPANERVPTGPSAAGTARRSTDATRSGRRPGGAGGIPRPASRRTGRIRRRPRAALTPAGRGP